MRIKDRIEVERTKSTVRRWLAWLLCIAVVCSAVNLVMPALAWPDDDTLPTVSTVNEGDSVMPLAVPEDNAHLLASFNFDSLDNRLEDLSGNEVVATLVDVENKIDTDKENSYLDLQRSNAYISLSGSILNDLTTMTVEMKVLTKDTGANWAFFAAPKEFVQVPDYEKYLGILLNDSATVERYANSGGRPDNPSISRWTVNKWHTIRVVFAEDYTALYIDDNDDPVAEVSNKSLEDCLGEDRVFWFGHASWGTGEGFNGCIDDIKIWNSADPDTGNLIANFEFDDESNWLQNSSGDGVIAEMVLDDDHDHIDTYNIIGTVSGNNYIDSIIGTVSGNDYVDSTISTYSGNDYVDSFISTYSIKDYLDNFFAEDSNGSCLDLRGKNAYLSLTNKDGSGVLADMVEVTVEMRVKTEGSEGNQWVFYAAPDNSAPWIGNEHYLGVHIEQDNTAFARRYDGARPNSGLSNGLGIGDWYTVKVVYEADKTTLSVTKDGESEAEVYEDTNLSANIWNCVGDNSVLWFGYSGWGGDQYFNGYIDDIKIWGTPGYVTEDVEKEQIITEYVDPANTVVNMFDYWVFDGQTDRDYGRFEINANTLVNSGINQGHLFLFDGSASIGDAGDNEEALGIWNKYGGTDFKETQSKWGIVNNILKDGYPQLAIDTWTAPTNVRLKTLWDQGESKTNESLDYLFNLENIDGKVSYPNVAGLFQIDNEGYYYFRSQEVFAELNIDQEYDPDAPKAKESKPDANKITLYKTPWLEANARGQFFPFNDWTDLFYEVNGSLVQRGDQGYQADHQPMNHWFGMTIETKFMQPTNGMINPDTRMTFEFSGDDDVWIFIDDVLVADVGGVHNRIRVTIDYSTGKIQYLGELADNGIEPSNKEDPKYFGYQGIGTETTLRAMFETADELNSQQWKGDTFADGTMHTLKFFYLERGNNASNCNIRFNLQEPIAERIRKVDQNGDPLEGATFELYKATVRDGININDGDWWHTASDFKIDGGLITTATIKSDKDGYASLTTADGDPLDLTQSTYYILEEKGTPVGYRKNPPIVLQYHEGSNTHTVVNKYETGAYASFLAEWKGSEDVNFAKYNEYNDGKFSKDEVTGTIDKTELAAGLAIVVPVVSSGVTSAENTRWLPMYGSNTYGWNTVTPSGNGEEDLIKALTEAAIMQITDSITQDWYLSWDGERLNGYMENLPGDATRYVFNDGNDGDLVTLFLPKNVLETQLGLSGTYDNADDRYMALRKALEGKNAKTLAASLSGLRILYTENYIKNNRTVIYVPNEQWELRVRKVDEKDNPIKGAVFALFDTPGHAAAGNAITSAGVKAFGTTDENGELIFRANVPTGNGYAQMAWNSSGTAVYWLKEITAPAGYELNKSLIRVEVSDDGIYANATGFDSNGNLLTGTAAKNDGIKVEASLGRLNQTMVKYAEGIVDETLKYITFTKQTAGAVGTWGDASGAAAKSEKLTYNTNGNGYGSVIFTADDGYIRVMPRQTQGITKTTAKRDTLTVGGNANGNPINLDGLFSLVNTVVVTDVLTSSPEPPPTGTPPSPTPSPTVSPSPTPSPTVSPSPSPSPTVKPPATGDLTVSNTVGGNAGDKKKDFTYTVELSDKTINGTYGDMEFVNGKATFTLKHGESKTARGLPAGITYTVTESDYEDYEVNSIVFSGTIPEGGTAQAAYINIKNISVVRDNVPKTGDNGNPGLWLAMLVLSLGVMGMSFRTLRRKRFLHEEEKHLK